MMDCTAKCDSLVSLFGAGRISLRFSRSGTRHVVIGSSREAVLGLDGREVSSYVTSAPPRGGRFVKCGSRDEYE
jgi:hypothetical protein